jgi:hypothetical protein
VLRLVHVFIHAVATTPAGLMELIRSYSPSASAFPRLLAGRLLHLRFRGLLSVYLHYGLHDRQVAYATLYTEGSSRFVASSAPSTATGWSDPVPGWDLHPLWICTHCGPAPFTAHSNSALQPLLRLIQTLSEEIKSYDQRIEKLASEKYTDTKLLRQVNGVGPVTSLAYVLTLETPLRFKRSRDVGPYLGLVPQQEDSGDSQPQLGISKAGDRMLRKLLVGSAHYILGPFGPDTDLRRFGMKLCQRGGKNAKKRASVAVARKLAVLLHRLWSSGEVYEPLGHGIPGTVTQSAAA